MDIEDYEFSGSGVVGAMALFDGSVNVFVMGARDTTFTKDDIIAMAKAVNLTAHDIECAEYKALCADLDLADEQHFDEVVELTANKIKINKRIN